MLNSSDPNNPAASMDCDSSKLSEPSSKPARHDWYQNETTVFVEYFVKGCDQSNVSVDFATDSLCIVPSQIPGATLELFLSSAIVPEKCSFRVTPAKVFVSLAKLDSKRWGGLVASEKTSSSLTYPSSSRSGPKNWDAIEKSVETEKAEGDAAIHELFQKLYADADDDTRRAMVKSYSESNGTCLSTNWSEVAKGRVATTPPDGLEAKEYPK